MNEMREPAPERNARTSYSLLGFLAMAFGVVGLMGIFATYALPIPLERALAREAAFDAATTAAIGEHPEADLAILAPRLDDSLPAILAGTGSLWDRIAAERLRQRAGFVAETAALGHRLRLLILMVTLMATVFGLAIAGKPARPPL